MICFPRISHLRDVIAYSAAIALSHDMFDAAIHLGVCDKIVPGLMIGALRYGYIPQIFAPAGPMPSGIPNPEKARVRQLFAEGKVGRNSNQMLMEIMGMQLPGASFVHPNTPLRDAITAQTTRQADTILFRDGPKESLDTEILTSVDKPFRPDGGLRLLEGNIGRSVMKVSAVKRENWLVEAPAIVIDDQNVLIEMHKAGELERDFVVVLRFQGPRANGMPELHKLTPIMGSLQDKGFKVAMVTDGRMSGASGKVPAAIHDNSEAGASVLGRPEWMA